MSVPVRTFRTDVTSASQERDGYQVFRRHWDAQTGGPMPLPGFDVGTSGDFRIRARAVTAEDVVIADVHSESLTGRTLGAGDSGARVLLHVVFTGSWWFNGPGDRGTEVTVPAGSYIARRNGAPTMFDVQPGTSARVLILPSSALGPGFGDRGIVGSAGSPEMRLVTAYADLLGETVLELGPGGVWAARDAMLELVRGAMRREFDDAEPRLSAPLVRAAHQIIDERLGDPDLSPSMVARELRVSVRALHRAFATADESVAARIRRRRIERARQDLTAPLGACSVSEVAARWHFADSSHFIRAYRKRYGESPARFARSRKAQPRAS
ncbi:helix-turn-helix domain-containing protein [Micromonospora sp. NPDC000663]|uniref:helix-turn-helix domain-containing protein n=1 Tax=Micromonospora sp. NPDC000663 TaxID=3364218 RepID=UPI0036A0D699